MKKLEVSYNNQNCKCNELQYFENGFVSFRFDTPGES